MYVSLAADSFLGGEVAALRSIRNATLLAVLVAAGMWVGLDWRSSVSDVSPEAMARWADLTRWVGFLVVLLVCSVLLLGVRSRFPSSRRAVSLLAIAVIAVDLVAIGWHARLTERAPDDVYPPSPVIARALTDLGWGRAYDEWVLLGNHGQAYGLPSVTRTFPLHLERFSQATDRFPLDRLLDLLNVRYVTTWQQPSQSRPALASQIGPGASTHLYARATAPGPAWIVPSALFVDNADAALNIASQASFDPRLTVVLERGGQGLPSQGGSGRVLAYRRGWNDLDLTAEAPQGGYLVVSEMAYPSWRAQLDDRPVATTPADYVLQAVWLPPGTHRFSMSFDSDTLKWGLAVTAATLLALAGYAVWSVQNRIGRTPRLSAT